MYIKLNQKAIFKSKKGKIYELYNKNGKLICSSMPEHIKRKPTKEILSVVKLETPMNEYVVYTDGGCASNPGGCGGTGVVIIEKTTGEITELSEGYFKTTNNRMEIMAIINALKHIPDNSKVYLYSDSQYALNCMAGIWEKRKNIDLWAELEKLSRNKTILTNWVRGHNGNPYNERCDELATHGTMMPTKKDEGYKSCKKNPSPNKRNEFIAISIDEEINKDDKTLSVNEYAEKYKINKSCAVAINKFKKSGKKFKNYIELKTGGMDHWSKFKKNDFIELYGIEIVEKVETYFQNVKDLEACFRWHSRGLSLKDSIRKTLVDIEVRENAQKGAKW